jgi:MoxR-like ATPase
MKSLHAAISAALIERDAEITAILLGLVAREHVLLVGPPGVAKSHLCRSVAAGISGIKYCERLLAPTTPPEMVFGPISLSALRDDRYEHVGDGTITDCHFALLDEFFRGSDAILDTLLHVLGPERQALIGTQQVRVPLLCAVGATNSWPDSQHQAAALDRWLIRRTVKPVSPQGRERLLYDELPAVAPAVSLAELDAAHASAMALPISDAAKGTLANIFGELHAAGIRPSDRRSRKSLAVARAAAYLDGATQVESQHLECLGDVLWDDPAEQPQKCAEIVSKISNPVGARLNELIREVDEIVTAATDNAQRMAALKKIEACEKEANKLKASGNGRAAKCVAYITHEKVRIQAAALGISPDKVAAMLAAGGK